MLQTTTFPQRKKMQFFTLMTLVIPAWFLQAHTPAIMLPPPTLGAYPNTTVIAGQTISVSPSEAPTGTNSTTAYTHTNFSGVFTVNPTTGVVAITDAKQAGTYTVTVKAFGAGGTTTATFTLTVTNPACSQGLFGGNTILSEGGRHSIAIGDFNGDGNQDLAAIQSNIISFRLGDGLGGFSGNIPIASIPNPTSLAIGDFNGDGNQDVAVSSSGGYSNGKVYIFLGNGLGGFTQSTQVIRYPAFVALGDFNGDGKQDFAAANNNSNTVSIRMGNGMGGFSGGSTIAVGYGPEYLAIGDFNEDGNQDFAVTNSISSIVTIRLGDGAGGFSSSAEATMGSTPYSIAIGDFNGDGHQDLAATHLNSNTVSIRLGDGAGGFSGSTEVAEGGTQHSIAIGDFNGDGHQDFAVTNFYSGTVSIQLGDGLGGFSGTISVAVGASPYSIAIGDFNGDGKQDLAVTNVYANTITIKLGVANEINLQGNSVDIADGDISPDMSDLTDFGQSTGAPIFRTFSIQNTGDADLSISGISSDNPLFSVGNLSPAGPIPANGSATFEVTFTPGVSAVENGTLTISNDDCDEGEYDFAVTAAVLIMPTIGGYPNATVVAGQNTSISPSVAPTFAGSAVAYTNTNFSGILSVDPATGVVTVTDARQAGIFVVTVKMVGLGGTATANFTLTVTDPDCSQGLFGDGTEVETEASTTFVALGDFNGDGIQDLAIANEGFYTISIRLGDGMGGFAGNTEANVGFGPQSIAVGDFNGDGKQDIAVANRYANSVSIRLGDGLGGFYGNTDVGGGSSPYSVAVGDFNGDGIQDLAIANENSHTVSIRLGDGDGGFSGSTEVAVGDVPVSVAVGDFNGDGHQDFATANLFSNTVSIRLGNGAGGFSGSTEVEAGMGPYSVAIGDFNGDAKQDIAIANNFSNTVSIRLGDGAGGFSGSTEIEVGNIPNSVAIGDFNGDGNQDFATANLILSVSIRLGDGAGGFSGSTEVALDEPLYAIAIGDFNEDGKQDFAVAKAQDISVHLGIANEINLQGNGLSIADGDNNPDTADHTDFGQTSGAAITRTFTIQNIGTQNINLPAGAITLSGTDAGLFAIDNVALPATIFGAGGTLTFDVVYTPTSAGIHSASVVIASDNCDEANYDFAIRGERICTPLAFAACPGQQTLVLDDNCSATLPDYLNLASISGNCTLQSLTQSPAPGSIAMGVGQLTVTLTVTDVSTQSNTCQFIVNKTDNTPPSLQCSNHAVVFNGQSSIPLVAGNFVTASDNCGLSNITLSPSMVLCQQVGQVIPVTATLGGSSCYSLITVSGLPCGWSQQPNGVNCINGNQVAYSPISQLWTATSTNCYSASPYVFDKMAFAQRTLCGNGSITAQVTSINGSGWAGVIMRETNDGGAKKIQLSTNLINLHQREFRTSTNSYASIYPFSSNNRYWLRIERNANQFSLYTSLNGQSWVFAGSQTISMNACIQMGLVLTSVNPGSTLTATFADVSYTGMNSALATPVGLDFAQEAAEPANYSVFPNPTTGELNIDLASYLGRSVRIEVLSIEGRLLQVIAIDEVEATLEKLDLSPYLPGIYLVKATTEGLPDAVQRIVKR
jgi:hypothetical protein